MLLVLLPSVVAVLSVGIFRCGGIERVLLVLLSSVVAVLNVGVFRCDGIGRGIGGLYGCCCCTCCVAVSRDEARTTR